MNNIKKSNEIVTINELSKVFCECGILPKYTDGTNYVGCGTRSNTFSVNVKKLQYNIYCNNERYDVVKSLKLTDTQFIANGNATDKTRNNKIVCKSTNDLIKMLKVVLQNDNKIALVK